MSLSAQLSQELNLTTAQVNAVIKLLDEGATVPFIARYRKEATGGVDDAVLREFEERLGYLRELNDRKTAVLKSIEEQGKLSDELKASILAAESKMRVEDLYLPYKPKRRTKAQIAKEAGLEALLDALLDDSSAELDELASSHINAEQGFENTEQVLEGARHIFMERVVENADLIKQLRQCVLQRGTLVSSVNEGQETAGEKFQDYFDFSEPLSKLPSHRILALLRGRRDGVLRLKVFVAGQDDIASPHTTFGCCDQMIAGHYGIQELGTKVSGWLCDSVRWAWRVKASMQLETEMYVKLREQAEQEAIDVFGHNLKDLLMAAPAGDKVTMGLDPGYRTGVKVAIVDATGKLLAHDTIFPHVPQKKWDQSLNTLCKLIQKYGVELISVGNGTASRETDKLVKELIKTKNLQVNSLIVSEAGASVYSASALATKEFPDLDVSFRGAVSIARRLQDPLAELVKIDPKAIGVGQYQHDVNQVRLAKRLENVVEDCVNAVGVDINTASVPLLTNVAGLSASLATNIVDYREQQGAFNNRQQLLSVPRLGPKAFEQAAGFLRISGGENPLDASAVHPEAYPLVERIIASCGRDIQTLMGDSALLSKLSANEFVDEQFGLLTVKDIIGELEKPGRDPRPEFKTASFKEGVEELKDLSAGMILEGVVSNVANFGAFVDLGVHQDGLVHVSAMSHKFVKDPREVVKAGDVVKVKVLAVDVQRKRISLTMKLDEVAPTKGKPKSQNGAHKRGGKAAVPEGATAMAQAFAKLK